MNKDSNPLVQQIISQAQSKASEIIKNANDRAQSIVLDAKEQEEKAILVERKSIAMRLDAISSQEASAKRNIDRLVELKSMDSSYNEVLSEINAYFERVASTDEFKPVLINWICEGVLGLDKKEAKVAFSAKSPVDEDMLREAERKILETTGATVKLSLDDTRCHSIGVVLSSLDGQISFDNELDIRLRRFQKDIRKIVQEENAKQNNR